MTKKKSVQSSIPWSACDLQVGTTRRPLPHTEDSEGSDAPRSVTDSTDQCTTVGMVYYAHVSMLHVISVICLVYLMCICVITSYYCKVVVGLETKFCTLLEV
jgi:hypothetical protein